MTRKPVDGNNEQPAETSPSIINGQRILTPEISNLITSVSELAIKNFETGLNLGRETENDIGTDKSLELFGNFVLDLNDLKVKMKLDASMDGF